MANFVKIGRRTVNLDAVAEMIYVKGGAPSDPPYVRIDFISTAVHAVIDKDSEPEAFDVLRAWMSLQPTIGEMYANEEA